jgi:hypothetical protein
MNDIRSVYALDGRDVAFCGVRRFWQQRLPPPGNAFIVMNDFFAMIFQKDLRRD